MRNLTFGIYPGGNAGSDNGLAKGNPDNPTLIKEALAQLQHENKTFLVRCYLHYIGEGKIKNLTPLNPKQYLAKGRKLDLVLGYQSKNGDITDWAEFIKQQINEYGSDLGKIQICEEPNLYGIPYVDGDSPNVSQAVVQGVITAKKEIKKLGLDVEVGFNGVPTFDPNNDFWRAIGELGTSEFIDSLDYIGLDFFPDVFRPIAFEEIRNSVDTVLNHFRNVSLVEAKIPSKIPLHITENGWATSPERSESKQAAVIETVIRAINEYQEKYNITQYELFDLRDANSSTSDFFYQFGIVKDDYTPKPAFETYKKLISELS